MQPARNYDGSEPFVRLTRWIEHVDEPGAPSWLLPRTCEAAGLMKEGAKIEGKAGRKRERKTKKEKGETKELS